MSAEEQVNKAKSALNTALKQENTQVKDLVENSVPFFANSFFSQACLEILDTLGKIKVNGELLKVNGHKKKQKKKNIKLSIEN